MRRRIERGQRLQGRRQSIAEAARASSRLWSADDRGEIKLLNGRYVDFQFVPHTHNCYSIAIVTSGVLEFDYRGSVESAVAGMVSIVEPGEVHNGRAGAGDEWTYRNFFVGSEMMRRIASRLGRGSEQQYFSTPSIEDRELFDELLELHVDLENSKTEPVVRRQLKQGLGRLIERHSNRRHPREKRSKRSSIERACNYIRNTYEENVTLETAASVAGYSPYHFLRLFQRQIGLTPHAFKLQVRIEKALELIEEGQPLCDTAHACGFADQSHLTRRFRQVMGVTPGQYARS